MAESLVQVTEGSGKKLHTFQRTIGANLVEDEVVLFGEAYLASYLLSQIGISAANAGDDILQIMAGASLNVRIRRIRVDQSALVTTAAATTFQVIRVTTAGTGGTAWTPSKLDNGDAASGATGAYLVPNATHGTAGAVLLSRAIWPVQTAGTGGLGGGVSFEWVATAGVKPIIIPAGATNGIVIRNQGAHVGLTVSAEIEFTESNF